MRKEFPSFNRCRSGLNSCRSALRLAGFLLIVLQLQATLLGQGGPFRIQTDSLPAGTESAAYSQTFQAVGGSAKTPYTWSVFTGSLPPGLTLAPTGNLTGVPSRDGTFNFTVRV